jgi:MerR family transcriptional regulator, light-induced transcriptional regulator
MLTIDDRGSAGSGGSVPLTIQQASELLTVPISTLRSWERRYDVPMTSRTVGGHRRYTIRAIDELRLMRDEIARGKRAGDAAVSARLLLEPAEPARRFIDAFLAAVQAMDPGRVRMCLDDAVGELGLGATVDDVMMPAMRRVGRWWEIGRCDVGHEHIATEAVRVWLGKFVAFAPDAGVVKPVLLTCGPRDSHTLGVEALGAMLAQSGLSCRLLGARTPSTTLVITARQVDAAAVVVVSHLSIGRRAATDAVRAVAALGMPTFYAGNAFIAAPIRQRLPGTYLGDSIRAAVRVVEAALSG